MRPAALRERLRSRTVRLAALLLVVLLAGSITVALVSSSPAVRTRSQFVSGTPEPDGTPVSLDTTLYLPATTPAPAVLLTQGFGGDKSGLDGEARTFARHGYVVLAYSARGFGRSGGLIHFASPHYEIRDARLLVDHLARLPVVEKRAGAPADRRRRLVLRRRHLAAAGRRRPPDPGGLGRHHLELAAAGVLSQQRRLCRRRHRRARSRSSGWGCCSATVSRAAPPGRRGPRGRRPADGSPPRSAPPTRPRPPPAGRRRAAGAHAGREPGARTVPHHRAHPADPGRAGLAVPAHPGRRQRPRHRRARHAGLGGLANRRSRHRRGRRRRHGRRASRGSTGSSPVPT